MSMTVLRGISEMSWPVTASTMVTLWRTEGERRAGEEKRGAHPLGEAVAKKRPSGE